MNKMRPYETTVIFNATLEDAELLAQVENIAEFLRKNGANIIATNNWGRKRLAYPIAKKHNGYYAYFLYEATAEVHPLMERMFSLNESLLRHLSLQLSAKEYEFRKNNMNIAPTSLDEVRKQAREEQEREEREKEEQEREERKQQQNKPAAKLPEVTANAEEQAD